ncbi:MBL fold metallo-hydrolase [Actinoplanes sp. NPDC049668]|uniref:MBL fold metallo-hydrolase n=1 Tax=unclassified Actinoplanes TaxID=2626549 RepID=UPI0033A8465F
MVPAEVEQLPGWVTLLRAPNPGPMTLDGTNTWVLRAPGEEFAVVIDPGPLDEGHLARIAEQGPFLFILVTHGHHDHVEGAARLSELLGGVHVLAADPRHGVGAGPLDRDESLGAAGLEIRVLDTPGHTADSVCFLVECAGERVVFTGDTMLGRGTTVVAWPDGDLGAYLTSLGALTAYEKILMLPGHGPALDDCAAVARSYLDHRRERLAQVRAAVAAGADSPEAVVAAVYPDIAPGVRFAAEWSVRAQLEYLRRESQRPLEQLDPL